MQTYFQIRIIGVVQDVFFRDNAKKTADKLGVKGFIRNQPDGSVYAEVSGDESSVKEFIDWCHVGPPDAKVSNVSVEAITGAFPHAGFSIVV